MASVCYRYCPGGPDSDFEYSTQSYTGYEVSHTKLYLVYYSGPCHVVCCMDTTFVIVGWMSSDIWLCTSKSLFFSHQDLPVNQNVFIGHSDLLVNQNVFQSFRPAGKPKCSSVIQTCWSTKMFISHSDLLVNQNVHQSFRPVGQPKCPSVIQTCWSNNIFISHSNLLVN